MRNVYLSTADSDMIQMFLDNKWGIALKPEAADLICFTGGADVSPFLYGERPHSTTHFSAARDNKEVSLWKSLPPKTPKVGICRGAQLGNVLCGGTLWQNVDNHEGEHPARDLSGIIKPALMMVSSSHHQMCKLTKEALVLTVAKKSSRKEGETALKTYGDFNNWDDPEGFFYDNFNFLGVQFHPEWQGYTMHERCTDYFFKLLDFCFDFERDDARDTKGMQEVPRDERGVPILG
jgi:gamma-glutamyl-gamma-aminobutyrate hydrolase PuuD